MKQVILRGKYASTSRNLINICSMRHSRTHRASPYATCAFSMGGGCAAAVAIHICRSSRVCCMHLEAASKAQQRSSIPESCVAPARLSRWLRATTHTRSHQKIDVVHAQAFIASGFPKIAVRSRATYANLTTLV
jgi:hypothetical protein